MTSIAIRVAASLLVVTALGGCTLVFDDDTENGGSGSGTAQTDDERIAALIEESFEQRLVPHIREIAVEADILLGAIKAGLDAAGEETGYRAGGQGAWNFAVRGEGVVVGNKLDTRARTLDVDVDDDSVPDLTLQLGPVVRGTALRDIAPFYDFNDFRDQIIYAQLARGINDRIAANVTLNAEDYIGETVRFVGATAVNSAGDVPLVAPIHVELVP